MASDPVLPDPSDISNSRLATSGKYVPKDFGEAFEEPAKVRFHDIYCELEMYRRRDNADKSPLLRMINDADLVEKNGITEWFIRFLDLPQYMIVENYNLSPYNVVLYDVDTPSAKIDLLPTDLYSLLYSLRFVFAVNKNKEYIPYVDLPVWGGRDILRLSRVLPETPPPVSPSDYLGVYIKVLSTSSVKKRLKLSGIGKVLGNKIPGTDGHGIFIRQRAVTRFAALIVRTYDAIHLNAEINSQYHATLQVTARKIELMPNFTREDYYWCVLDSFFGLDVPNKSKLPSFYVLRLFHRDYLCETYSLYYSERCKCVECGKAGLLQAQRENVEEEEEEEEQEQQEDGTDSEIETLEYGSDIDL